MKRWILQYKKSAILAMICGLVTAMLGIWAFTGEEASRIAVFVTMLINTALHCESYCTTLLFEHRKNANVLSMAIAEAILLSFFVIAMRGLGWREFVLLFAVYLVFNGTSLIAIPSAFSRCCGAAAAALGALLFYFGREPGFAAAVLTGLNLILNGGERIVMSALGGKKKIG